MSEAYRWRPMGTIRELTRNDIPAVVALRLESFQHSHHESAAALEAYIERIFFAPEWTDKQLPSLVLTNSAEEVVGFIGLLPRPMEYKGEPLLAGAVTQLMVAEAHRGRGGVRLLREAFNSPCDLLFSDSANEAARTLWKGLGANTSIIRSLEWNRPLRPWSVAATTIGGRHRFVRAFRFASRPLLGLLDRISARDGGARWAIPDPASGSLVEIRLSDLRAASLEWPRQPQLRPAYNEEQLRWIASEMTSAPWSRSARVMGVHGPGGEIVGGFAYSVPTDDNVLYAFQVDARPRALGQVLDHLLRHAWQEGFHSVAGRFDPRIASEMGIRRTTLRREGPWFVYRSPRKDVLDAMQRGDASISMLEGERYLSF